VHLLPFHVCIEIESAGRSLPHSSFLRTLRMKECILLFILQPYTGPSTPETYDDPAYQKNSFLIRVCASSSLGFPRSGFRNSQIQARSEKKGQQHKWSVLLPVIHLSGLCRKTLPDSIYGTCHLGLLFSYVFIYFDFFIFNCRGVALYKLSWVTALNQVTSLDFHPKRTELLCSCDDNGEIRFWLVGQNAPSRVSRERLKTFSDLLFFFLMSCETA